MMTAPEDRFVGVYSDRDVALAISNMTAAGLISEEQMEAIVFIDHFPSMPTLSVEKTVQGKLRLSLVHNRTIMHFLPPE